MIRSAPSNENHLRDSTVKAATTLNGTADKQRPANTTRRRRRPCGLHHVDTETTKVVTHGASNWVGTSAHCGVGQLAQVSRLYTLSRRAGTFGGDV